MLRSLRCAPMACVEAELMKGPRRSVLFVPGSRPERFAKALSSGADMVCVDLEDAVAPADKVSAREHALAFLQNAATDAAPQNTAVGVERIVRINSLRSRVGLEDLLALLDTVPAQQSGFVFLPKVDEAAELRWADALLEEAGSALRLAALLESVAAIDNATAIAAASTRLELLVFGGADLAAELGVAVADEPLAYARSRVVYAARRAGVAALDVPTLDFRNLDQVQSDAEQARRLGFSGKTVLHPSNVAAVNAAFTPSAAEIAYAERVVAAFHAASGGVTSLDGRLVERPVVRAMQELLTRAGGSGKPHG